MSLAKVFTRENRLAGVLYPVLVILMEAFWVYPWLIWIGYLSEFSQAKALVSLPSVIIVLALSVAATRFFLKRKWSIALVRAAIIGCGTVAGLLILRVEYGFGYAVFGTGWIEHVTALVTATFTELHSVALAIPALLLLWWRGILLERKASSIEGVYRSFLSGIIGFIIITIFWNFTFSGESYSAKLSDIGLYAICFFIFGLLSLAVRNLHLRRKDITEPENRTSVWRSFLPILLPIAGIALLGIITAAMLSPDFFNTVSTASSAVWHVISRGISFIAYPLLYVASAVYWIMKWLVSLFPKGAQPAGQGFEGSIGDQIEATASRMPATLTTVFQLLAAAVLLGLLIFILAKAIKRFSGRQEEETKEIRESVLTLEALRNDLGQFLQLLGGIFKRKQKLKPLFYDDEVDALSVRDMYKRLLWEGMRSGVSRRAHETPAEYAARLDKELYIGGAELRALTDLYVYVRYADRNLPAEHLQAARDTWVTLRESIRKIGEADE